jgi:glycosyltransferase involved in cell wall biosynthesis
MPVLNGGDLFRGALESILGQTYRDIEIVISDNGSSDGTSDYAKSRAAADPRIRYFWHEKTLPALQNYRFLVEHSRGEYFFWAPHDDWWDARFVEVAVKALDQRPSAALAMGTVHYLDRNNGTELWNDHPPYGLDGESAYERIHYYLTHPITDMLYYAVFRRTAFADVEWIDSTCPEKSIILAAIAKGPVANGPGMEYFNRLSRKTGEQIAAVNALASYSFRYQWRACRSAVVALYKGVSSWDFVRLLPLLIVRQNWHKQLVKDLLTDLRLLRRAA